MIVHTLLLHPKPETTEQEMKGAFSLIEALQQKIPGIVSIQIEMNRNPNHQGYTYGFIMRFVDDEHFQAYFPHPEHKAAGAELRRLCDNALNFDYEE